MIRTVFEARLVLNIAATITNAEERFGVSYAFH